MNYFATPQMIGRGAYAVPEYPTAEALICHLDYLGIDRALVCSVVAQDYAPNLGNRELLEEIAPYRERLVPVFILTPSDYFEHGTLQWLREQAAAGMMLFTLFADRKPMPVPPIDILRPKPGCS